MLISIMSILINHLIRDAVTKALFASTNLLKLYNLSSGNLKNFRAIANKVKKLVIQKLFSEQIDMGGDNLVEPSDPGTMLIKLEILPALEQEFMYERNDQIILDNMFVSGAMNAHII